MLLLLLLGRVAVLLRLLLGLPLRKSRCCHSLVVLRHLGFILGPRGSLRRRLVPLLRWLLLGHRLFLHWSR